MSDWTVLSSLLSNDNRYQTSPKMKQSPKSPDRPFHSRKKSLNLSGAESPKRSTFTDGRSRSLGFVKKSPNKSARNEVHTNGISKSKTRQLAEKEFEKTLQQVFVALVTPQHTNKITALVTQGDKEDGDGIDIQKIQAHSTPKVKLPRKQASPKQLKMDVTKSPKPSTSKAAPETEASFDISQTEAKVLGFLTEKTKVPTVEEESKVDFKPTDLIDVGSSKGKALVIDIMKERKLGTIQEFQSFVEVLKSLHFVAVETQTPFKITVEYAQKLRSVQKVKEACLERRADLMKRVT